MCKILFHSFFSLLAISQAYVLPQVKLGRTTILGRNLSEKVEFFGGIPFAEPPLGPLRLSATVLKTRLDTPTFNASSYGKSCIQPTNDPTTTSEDCLTINVFRPAGVSSKEKLPVLFWTYEGGFVSGSSSRWDGSNLVNRSLARGTPVIYVSFNYRLGPLGFPQGQEADDRRALNLGIHDQTAALKWVQENIHLFGGDKDKLGQLARAAILQSGSVNGFRTYPAARNEAVWQEFVGNVTSCAKVSTSGKAFDCLKDAPAEEIMSSVMGSVYPDYASRLYTKGEFAQIPFIAGTNRDEGTLFAQVQEMTDPDLRAWIVEQHSPPTVSTEALEEVADKLLELYPDYPSVGSPFETGDELFGLPSSFKRRSALVGDMWFAATRRQWSQAAAHFGVKTYGYHFTQAQHSSQPELGVAHGADRPYVYGEIPASDTVGQSLSTTMMDYWISFAVSLDPNDGRGIQRPVWPLYTEADPVLMQLDGANLTSVKDNFRNEQISFLNENSFVLRR